MIFFPRARFRLFEELCDYRYRAAHALTLKGTVTEYCNRNNGTTRIIRNNYNSLMCIVRHGFIVPRRGNRTSGRVTAKSESYGRYH